MAVVWQFRRCSRSSCRCITEQGRNFASVPGYVRRVPGGSCCLQLIQMQRKFLSVGMVMCPHRAHVYHDPVTCDIMILGCRQLPANPPNHILKTLAGKLYSLAIGFVRRRSSASGSDLGGSAPVAEPPMNYDSLYPTFCAAAQA